MARRKGNLFSGILGPVNLKVVKGVQHVTSRKGKGETKLSPDSIKSAGTFGLASRLGNQMKLSFWPLLRKRMDPNIAGHLSGALNSILQQGRDKKTRKFSLSENSFDSVVNLDFNPEAPMKKRLLMSPNLTFDHQQLTIKLPQAKPSVLVRFPATAAACRITIAVACFALAEGLRFMHPLRHDVLIDKKATALSLDPVTFVVPEGCLCIVITSIVYLSTAKYSGKPITDLKFNPSCISAAVITSGTFSRTEEFPWIEMDELRLE
jgi:hypothetical protein